MRDFNLILIFNFASCGCDVLVFRILGLSLSSFASASYSSSLFPFSTSGLYDFAYAPEPRAVAWYRDPRFVARRCNNSLTS